MTRRRAQANAPDEEIDGYEHLLPARKQQRPRSEPAGLDKEVLESALVALRQQLRDGLAAAGHAVVKRKDPSSGRFFRVRTGGWMVEKRETWKVDGGGVEVSFSSSTTKHAQLWVAVNLDPYPFDVRGSRRESRMVVDLKASRVDVAPLIEKVDALLQEERRALLASMDPEARAACEELRVQALAAARLVREFIPAESITERKDMLSDGSWVQRLLTPVSGTQVTAYDDGLEIKTALLTEDQARRLLTLCKEMGV